MIRTNRRTLCLAFALMLTAACRAQQPAPQTPAAPIPPLATPAPQTPTQNPATALPASDPAKLAADAAKQQLQAEQALAFLLKHEVLDPSALVPSTGKPLPPNGKWLTGKDRPASCPTGVTDPCVRILYRVPATTVSCEWVVLVKPGTTPTSTLTGTIIEQNLDATHYLLRFIPADEAAPLIVSRAKPLPVASTGTVEIGVIVGTTGEPTRVTPLSGPPDLRAIALPEANEWIFRPLQVGGRTIPYQTNIKFIFGNRKVTTEP